MEYIEREDAVLSIKADDPNCCGQDPTLVGLARKVAWHQLAPVLNTSSATAPNWLVIAATPAWAADLPGAPACSADGSTLKASLPCRVDTADPIAAWRKHMWPI
jgi:hypothetical protein